MTHTPRFRPLVRRKRTNVSKHHLPMKTNSLRAWLLAVRPYSFGATSTPIIVASALAWSDGSFHWLPALLCLLFALWQIVHLAEDIFKKD